MRETDEGPSTPANRRGIRMIFFMHVHKANVAHAPGWKAENTEPTVLACGHMEKKK